MNIEAEKLRILDAIINVKDINLLHQVRELLNKEKSNKYNLTTDQIEELELRKSRHKNGLSESYNWKEVKMLIRKQ